MKTPSKNLLMQLIAGVREPLMIVDVSKDRWQVSFFNPALLRLLDLPSGEVSHQDAEPLLFKVAGSAAINAVRDCDEQRPQTTFESQYVSASRPDCHIDGEVVALNGARHLRAVYLRPTEVDEGNAVNDTGSHTLKVLGAEHTAFVSRDAWFEFLQRDAAIAAREQVWLAVIVFRIDALDSYIETFGQHAGDSAVKRISHSIRRRLKRAGDTGARTGADEISVLVHGSSAAAAREFADSIAADVRALAIHHPRSRRGRHMTLSIGVCAEVPEGADAPQTLLRRARAQLDAPAQVINIAGGATTH